MAFAKHRFEPDPRSPAPPAVETAPTQPDRRRGRGSASNRSGRFEPQERIALSTVADKVKDRPILDLGVGAGIQITGSHNPPEYNGFKICLGKESVHGEELQELYRIAASGKFRSGNGAARSEAVIDRYVDDIVSRIGPLSNPSIAWAVGGLISERVMQRDMMGDLTEPLNWYDRRAADLRRILPDQAYQALPQVLRPMRRLLMSMIAI